MTQGTKRLTEELHRLEGLKLREILDEMAKTDSPTVVLSFNGTQDKPVAAVALITGPDTADRIQALEKPNKLALPEGGPDGQIGVRWRAIRILKTLRDGLDDSFSDQGALITEADKVIRALRSGPTDGEMDELRADAERYRWLRNPDNFGPDEGEGPSGWEQLCDLAGDDFDAFIDERMKQDHGAAEDA
ncbi:MAG: hypothetical protein ACX93N_16140 [Pseudohaliea sp.]